MIKIACAGFPIGQKKYQSIFPTVELTSMFNRSPRMQTLERWRAEAEQQFEFIVCASKLITDSSKHSAQNSKGKTKGTSAFQDTAVMRQALHFTQAAAETLRSRLILFKLAAHFGPTPDNIKIIQNFFGSTNKGHTLYAWEPPATWPFSLVDTLSDAFRLMPANNPLRRNTKPYDAPMRYFRLGAHGKTSGSQRITDDEMRQVQAACDLPLCYVVFNNGPTAYEDALRFQAMVPLSAR